MMSHNSQSTIRCADDAKPQNFVHGQVRLILEVPADNSEAIPGSLQSPVASIVTIPAIVNQDGPKNWTGGIRRFQNDPRISLHRTA